MRWSEFVEKECVDLRSGEKLGSFSHADMVIDSATGRIESILIPVGTSFFKKNNPEMELDWSMIKKIGPEMVIIDSAIGRVSVK
ncbi:YlmC/YmxH family sporulation protein [Thermoflavimicrobium dichotomicum]|uniref:Sporulation protein, YlmC/YmxH family n=1 Tax=Thermoflavimicrobium dichotomicum TaxID=46223 RepID=A0A1I3PRN7_9BACL|nr:YlmC/YmxH family sporulation protein [Thermoflavimicrobium dichotomicum]SFJ23656.1 sporulation protein, YlmC/YmxH family [Thermoflavimicrobium dichotomicum]